MLDEGARTARRATLVALAVLAAVGLAIYGQVAGFSFVTADDTRLIVHNPHVTDWWHASLRDRLLTPEFGYAIPVTVASFALDWAIFGGRASGFHLVDLALHLACTALVFRVLAREVRIAAAFGGALLFLVHPAQAEAVAFVTQRKDLLVALFSLLALDRLLASELRGLRARDAALVVAFGAAAVFSKPSALIVGPLLGAIWLLLRRRDALRAPGPAMAIASTATAAGAFVLDVRLARATDHALEWGHVPIDVHASLVGTTFVHYVEALLLPIDLAPKTPRPTAIDGAAIVVVAIAAFVAIALLVFAIRTRRRRVALPLAWTLGAYLPIANVVLVARYVADSFLYLPMIGLALGVGYALDALLARHGRTLVGVASLGALGVVACVLALLAHAQASIWRDEERLFAYVYRLYPDSPDAYAEYVERLEREGRRAEANAVGIDYFERALRENPSSLPARHWLVRLELQRGDVDAARRVLDATPPSQRTTASFFETRLELAMATKDWPTALDAVRALVKLDPNHPSRSLLPTLEAKTGARAP